MPSMGRHKTKYPGVYYIIGEHPRTGKPEKVFYIRFKIKGKTFEEKAGRQYTDHMTPAKASHIRADKIKGRLTPKTVARKQHIERVTINDLFETFCEHKRHLRSLRYDVSRYNNYLRGEYGDLQVSEIMPVMVQKLKNELSKNRKPATVKQVLVLLQRIVNFGHGLHLCPRFDFKIDMPRFDNRVTEDLTPDERKRLLSVLNDYERLHNDSVNIMRLALFTGLRRGMIFGLKWQDVDFDRGFIYIRESEAKSKVSERVPMNRPTRDVLLKIRALRRDSEYVFPDSTGERLCETAYSRHFEKIRDLAELPKNFRPLYGLRHTFASEAASSGEIDLYTLQKLMTHKSPQMTQRYAHLRDDTLKKASDAVADALFETEDEE